MENREEEEARKCAVCKKRNPNENSFAMVCFCDDNQGICRECFLKSGMDKKALREVRDYGWQILGKNHALSIRASESSDTDPMFESMMLQDPSIHRNLLNFFAGQPMEPSPYAVYVSPALQTSRKKKDREDLFYALVFLIAALGALFCVYKISL